MFNSEIDAGNIIAVSEEDLKEEQRQAMEKAVEEYRQLCLKSFSLNKSGQVIQKQDLPLPRQVTFDSNPGKLQEMVNSAVNHALINHSNVLSNTVHNAVVRTLKEGQAAPHYVGPAYHQPEPASVKTPSAPSAVVGTEVTSPPVLAGSPNVQSTPVQSDQVLPGGRVQLNTDLSASAMSGPVSQNSQIPTNWWGYGMPPESSAFNPRLPQVFDAVGRAPIPSAVSPMAQVPQYAATTSVQPTPGGFQMPMVQTFNSSPSASLLPMQQKAPAVSQTGVQFMPQTSYNYPTISANYQPSVSFVPMSSNNDWSGQLPVQHTVQRNQQVAGIQQGHMQAGFQNQASAAQPMNPFQQANGPQVTANMPIAGDRGPQRYVEGCQQAPPVEIQPVRQQEVDAFWADKIAEIVKDQFGIKPKVNTYSYRTPYPPAYDLIPLPNRYKVPDFTKFSGQDDTSTMEHVNRFIIQCGEAASRDELRVRLFSSSLSGSAFTWFISLPPNSIITWADLEKQFHKYFFAGIHEKKLTDLVKLRQRNDESVESFVQRLRDVKNKCYSLVLDDRQLADLAFQGLLPHLKDRYASQEFESLSHLVQRISDQDTRVFEPKKNWSKKVSFVEEVGDSDSDEEPVIGLAEWVKNKKPISCPFGQKEPEKFTFDITKADKIFDLLLQEGQIKLSPNHVIPSAEELKKILYCKWHNATSHSTNECKVFRQQLQSAIESGRIKFGTSKAQKPMKIDQHPFPANMLEAKGKTKVLTSEAAEKNASVDPQHRITTDDAKSKGLLGENSSSKNSPRPGIVITRRRQQEGWR